MSHKIEEQDTLNIDIIEFLKLMLNKIWLIIICTVLGAAIAYAYTSVYVEPQYKATAKMYVNNRSITVGGASVSISGTDISTSKSLVSTYIEILKTRVTLERVIDEAKLKNADGSRMSYATLLEKIDAASLNQTEVFAINVTDTDPNRAMLIANTLTEVLPYTISTVVEGSSVKTVDYAVVGVKVSPSVIKDTVIGAVVGIVLAVGILFLMMITDNYIHDESYLLKAYDIPLLATIPDLNLSNEAKYKYRKYGYGKYSGYHGNAYAYYRSRQETEKVIQAEKAKTSIKNKEEGKDNG